MNPKAFSVEGLLWSFLIAPSGGHLATFTSISKESDKRIYRMATQKPKVNPKAPAIIS